MYIGMYLNMDDTNKPIRYVASKELSTCINKLINMYYCLNKETFSIMGIVPALMSCGTYAAESGIILNIERTEIENEE